MKTLLRSIVWPVLLLAGILVLSGCERDAQVASRNLSKAADMFEITRRVVFYDAISGTYLLSIEGRCSIDDDGNQLEVTCKIADGEFKKHFLGLSDNVTYFAEQLDTADVSVFHHRIIFKPQMFIPEMDVRGDMKELLENRY